MQHETIEKNINLMAVLIVLVVSFAGIIEIVPLMTQKEVREPAPGIVPYTPLQLAGRDVYVSEGCYNCHSQMIRPFRSEVERYGPYSRAGESVYDRPHQWGSKRTGPDLARVGGRYSDDWHRVHLINPRNLVPESNMPGYPWLEDNKLDPELMKNKIKGLQMLGDPYPDEVFATIEKDFEGKTEMDALIIYLQHMGTNLTGRKRND